MSNVWSEHDEDGAGSGVDPEQSLSSIAEDAVVDVEGEEEVETKAKKKSGLNPRLLFVIFALVAVAGSGFFFLKMVKRPAVAESSDVAYAPTLPSEPSPGQAGSSMIPGAADPQTPGVYGGMLSGQPSEVVPPLPGMAGASEGLGAVSASQDPVMANVNEQVPIGAQVQAPVVPVVPDRSGEVADLQMQLEALQKRLDGSQEELGNANAKLAEAKAKASPQPAGASQRPVAASAAEKTPRRVAARPARVRGKAVITEAKDSDISNVSIRAIYPTSGKNPQAWVNVDGVLVEVTVGSVVGGAKIREIKPATMEIVTDAGVIRARRQP